MDSSEETTVTTGAAGTSVSTPGITVTTDPMEKIGIKEYILYKLDRTLAILGVIAIAIAAIFFYSGNEGVQIVSASVGGLVAYVGGRTK